MCMAVKISSGYRHLDIDKDLVISHVQMAYL